MTESHLKKSQWTLKLGTRKSLLAWAQSLWVAREIERLNHQIKVELIGIETRGDQILDIPLSQVEGKEFFTAELDRALISGKVDLSVHSMKDLSLDRPSQISCISVPPRENPRDILLLGAGSLARIRNGIPLHIGTSSPRRLKNTPEFLGGAIPNVGPKLDPRRDGLQDSHPSLKFVEIRGNVNTRIGRLFEPQDSARYLDGVVLAFAGLIRLWSDTEGRKTLEQLFLGTRKMIMPLKECPSAPAQGALAVECRTNDDRTREILGKLTDKASLDAVTWERETLAQWGGGCHQKLGATSISIPELGPVLYVRGEKPDGSFIEEIQWNKPNKPALTSRKLISWDGSIWKASTKNFNLESIPNFNEKAVFIAHSRAVHSPQLIEALKGARIWVSGITSWRKLAEMGLWVEGCAEGLGFETLRKTLKEPVLGLPELEKWTVLTHSDAIKDWKELGFQILATYQINLVYKDEAINKLKQATHVFWSSGSQYDALKEWVSIGIHHACGPGKTAVRLRNEGVRPSVFPSVEEWKKWIQELI